MTTHPTQFRGIWIPKSQAVIVYEPQRYRGYRFSETEIGIDDLVEDICEDISAGFPPPELTGWQTVEAKRRGANFTTAATRHGPGIIHVVIDVEWLPGDGTQYAFVVSRHALPRPAHASEQSE